MKRTRLRMKCEKHGEQVVVATIGGLVYCNVCQKEWEFENITEK